MKEPSYKTELRRVFLLADLPEPLTRASEHLQLFDNYIKATRMRLRYIRVPQTKEWTRILEQRFPAAENDLSIWNVSEIHLNQEEYQAFERFEGTEIRKNRYFYESNGKSFEMDVFLGALWGLCLAKVHFETIEEMREFQQPEFAVAEVTNNKFFTGAVLVEKTFADVQAEFEKITNSKEISSTRQQM
jgi:CYTH domain-containing protein